MNLNSILTLSVCGLLAAACAEIGDDYDVFRIEVDGQQFIANGVIDGSTPSLFEQAMEDNPNVKELVLQTVPGSANDEANLVLARMVRNAGFTTIVPADGMVASGGTDLFLAGVERIVGPGACIGVHSWATGGGLGGEALQGRDVPRDSEDHSPYLSYYAEIGIDGSFYWFTLEAADADGMHWMSTAEINRYGMVTTPLSDVEANSADCEGRG